MPLNIATIRVELTGAPSYRIASSPGTPFAILSLGPMHLTSDDPGELRRLADVAANAADVLEQAQKAARPASKCCDAATHDRVRASDAIWYGLPVAGYQDDGAGGWLTLRNCHCGGTNARPSSPGEHARRDVSALVP